MASIMAKRWDASLCSLLDVDKAESPAQAKRFAEANSETLREHFYDMTAALLVPFAPYCQPALPGEAADLAAEPSPLPVFDPATFLETLPLHDVPRALHKRLGSQVMPCVPSLRAMPSIPHQAPCAHTELNIQSCSSFKRI